MKVNNKKMKLNNKNKKLNNKISFSIILNLLLPGVSAKRKCLWSSSSRSRGSPVRMGLKYVFDSFLLHFCSFLFCGIFNFVNRLAGGVAPPQAPPLPSKLPSIKSSWSDPSWFRIPSWLIQIDSESPDWSFTVWDWFRINAVKIASYQCSANWIGEETIWWNGGAEFSHYCFIKWNVAYM